MRIVNILAGFQNAYTAPGWQLWNGSDLIGVYHTRKSARSAAFEYKREIARHGVAKYAVDLGVSEGQ